MTLLRVLAVGEPGLDPDDMRPFADQVVSMQACAWSPLVFVGASRDYLPDQVAAGQGVVGYMFECDAKPKA